MRLPDYVNQCIARLESAGFAAYAVGGCVRDALLGLAPKDYDLCSAARPEQTEAIFSDFPLVLAGEKHGTVGVVTSGGVVEITTFRTEGGYRDCRHPDWVAFVPDITSDLGRRDFTVNAMAYSPSRGLADPFGGQADLNSRILRTVGDPEARFREDALRILRGVRFAVVYRLTPDPATAAAMERLAPELDSLARERVFEELCKLLPAMETGDFCRYAPILGAAIPELAPMIGFDQRSPHHAYDLFTHTAHVAGAVPGDLALRWAALLHDVGKIPCFTTDANGRGHFYGHGEKSAEMADAILRRLKAPTALRQQVVTLIGCHMTRIEPTRRCVRRWLGRLGGETLNRLLTLQEADMGGKGTGEDAPSFAQFARLREILTQLQAENAAVTLRDLAVNGHDLAALGLQGREIGECLNALLDAVIEETAENSKASLLSSAEGWKEGRQ